MAGSATSSLVPAMTPPPGVASHPQNHLYTDNIVVQTVCMSIAGILFFLRCYVRLGFSSQERQWLLEDWMVCLSFIGLALYSAHTSVLMNSNAGGHRWDLTRENADQIFYQFWIGSIIYGPFIFATKFSILLMYLRVFVVRRRSCLHTTVWVFTAISASFYLALTLAKIFQCVPIQKAFQRELPGHCLKLRLVLQISGYFNTISDAIILLLPVPAIWNLRLRLRKKIAVWAVLTLGAVAPVFSSLGIWYRSRVPASEIKDMTYDYMLLLLWGTAEVATGVICACLPSVYGLFHSRSESRNTPSIHQQDTRPSINLPQPRNSNIMHDSYLELDEGRRQSEKAAVITTVRAGDSPVDSGSDQDATWLSRRSSMSVTASESSHGFEERSGGIMKTVRIEQSNSSSQI